MLRSFIDKLIRFICIFLAVAMVIPSCLATEGEICFIGGPALLRPGKSERFVFTASLTGTAEAAVFTLQGERVNIISVNLTVREGENSLIWDGMNADGTAMEPGEYELRVTLQNTKGVYALQVGSIAPAIQRVTVSDTAGVITGVAICSCAGTLQLLLSTEDGTKVLLTQPVESGENAFSWDGTLEGKSLSGGEYTLQLRLTDASGFSGTKQSFTVTLPEVQEEENEPVDEDMNVALAEEANNEEAETASIKRQDITVIPSAVTTPGEEFSYWTWEIGNLDEEKVWQILMQPMWVIDGDQQKVYRLRATPDSSTKRSNVVGEITYASQGVHILETLDNGWTYVEAYNSSYGPNCKSRPGYGVTNELIRGYVQTSLLKQITPYEHIGIVVDKLTQEMYIFEDGKCTGKLLVSTGLNNKTQSWNETPSGEYVMISKIGGFAAGNLWCSYGMRINGGCAIHEVPYIGNKNTPAAKRDYSSTVKQLGKKASHGCIRVQKAKNDAGQNIKWLWDNMKKYTKVLIWEDSGRFIDYPDDSTLLYYNPNGGKNYHENQNCSAVKERYLPLTAFTYGEFETGIYASLTPCASCATTIKRKAQIDEINAANGFYLSQDTAADP